MNINQIAVLVFLCGLLTIATGVFTYRRRQTTGALAFSFFMFSFAIYSISYSLELAGSNLSMMLFWNKVQYLGILSFPTFYLIFALQYTGHDRWLTRRAIAMMFLIPLGFLFVKIFDDNLHLIYRSVEVDTTGLIPLLHFDRGPIYGAVVVYNITVVSIANVFLIEKRRFGSALYRAQTTIMLVAAFIIYGTYAVYLSDIVIFPSLRYLDLNPLAYTLWGVVISLALFKYGLLDLSPIARDALIGILQNGVVVLDNQSRLVDANPAALRIFNWEHLPVGKRANEFMGDALAALDLENLKESELAEIVLVTGGTNRCYDLLASNLKNKMGLQIGSLIMLHDITERKETEKKLQELSLVDELTGLSNRRGLRLLANQMISMANRMKVNATLFFLDLDDLKKINDNYGHAEGDAALVATADILRTTFRSADILARIGGDEFVVLALETNGNSISSMLDRLMVNLDYQNQRSQRYPLGFSIGSARYEWQNPKTLEELFSDADRSMYESKKLGKRVEEPEPWPIF